MAQPQAFKQFDHGSGRRHSGMRIHAVSTAGSGRERYLVQYDEVQIETVAEGAGALIVMLPSLGRDSDDYDAVGDALIRSGYRVLRPAPRGIGLSKGPEANLTLHSLARDVAMVIEREGGGPAVIIGHAFGNWVARTVATDYPELVRGVVIAAAGAKRFDPRLSGYIDHCEDTSLPDDERLKYLRLAFFAPASDPRPWLQGWHRDAKRLQRQARAATPVESFWGAGSAPVLDLIAGDDPFRLPATRDENQQELGDRVTICVVPNASHALLPEQPEAVASAVSAWIRQLPD